MTEYHFNAELAQRHGVNGAIFLHAMSFWIAKNQANGRHFHEGRTWTYNTLEALAKLFPFWTRRQVERIVAKLKEDGVLLTGNFSQDKTDRTVWYALADSVLEVYGLLAVPISPEGDMEPPEPEVPKAPISPSGEMHFTESGQPFHQTGKCNKETVTDQLDNIPPIVPQGDKPVRKKRQRSPKSEPTWEPQKFEGFWRAYPRDEDRAKAVEQWDKLPEDRKLLEQYGTEEALLHDIALGLKRHLDCEDWKEGRGIPYAFRWLRDRRWTEKRKMARPIEPSGSPEVTYGWR